MGKRSHRSKTLDSLIGCVVTIQFVYGETATGMLKWVSNVNEGWMPNMYAFFADGYSGYKAVDDLLTLPNTGDEYISSRIVENSPEWFEPIEDTVWEAFVEKVEEAKNDLVRKMRAEWRKK